MLQYYILLRSIIFGLIISMYETCRSLSKYSKLVDHIRVWLICPTKLDLCLVIHWNVNDRSLCWALHIRPSLVYSLFPVPIFSKNRGRQQVIIDYLLCQGKVYSYKVKHFSNALHCYCNKHFYQKLPVHMTFNQTINFDVPLQNWCRQWRKTINILMMALYM